MPDDGGVARDGASRAGEIDRGQLTAPLSGARHDRCAICHAKAGPCEHQRPDRQRDRPSTGDQSHITSLRQGQAAALYCLGVQMRAGGNLSPQCPAAVASEGSGQPHHKLAAAGDRCAHLKEALLSSQPILSMLQSMLKISRGRSDHFGKNRRCGRGEAAAGSCRRASAGSHPNRRGG